jgi:hypothetical protein
MNSTTEQNIDGLYHICLQYLQMLYKKKHPMMHLITTILDDLIALKSKILEDKNFKDEEVLEQFNKIHSKAYVNIQSIYDYDAEEEKKQKELEEKKEKEEIIKEVKDKLYDV